MLLSLTLLLLALTLQGTEAALEFNYEVERRVYERINDYMSAPKHVVHLLSRVKRNDHLNLLDYEDKEAFASMAFSMLNEFNAVYWIYYGTESGMFFAYASEQIGVYKEPGDTYVLGSDPEMEKYHNACVNHMTGDTEKCTQEAVGAKYISCVDNCSYILCPDLESQSCTDSEDCGYQQKWCMDYEILETEDGDPPRGYIPRTDYCITDQGDFSQERGSILQLDGSLGSCFYADRETRVERNLTGNYVYCQKLKESCSLDTTSTKTDSVCNNVFAGGFRSSDYDPRYRPWYMETKNKQRAKWSPPYTNFESADVVITYTKPFYTKDDERRTLFAGVFAADYTFQNITNYLSESYPANAGTYVVIYEQARPNYLVATSTGREVSQKVLVDDETAPCAHEFSEKCTNVRKTMRSLTDKPFDDTLLAAYLAQEESGYPTGELVTSQTLKQAFVSQSSSFSDGEDLKWTILIISEVERSDTDALTKSNPLFAVVCLIAAFGFILCLLMFIFMFMKRSTRAVILADWRFTLAFLFGCALLNLSSLTFLGDNTEVLCMTRMWSFHLLFALTISPLLVKVYRMYRLVGSQEQSPTVISNPQAVALAMPIVIIQLVILIVFSILDPPLPEATITIDDSVVSQVVECAQETEAFAIAVLVYEGSLVFIGCVLAFMTRNLASNIGQSKELIFSMYNIAFVGIVTAVLSAVTDIDAVGRAVFFSIGIFCGTVFSSVAFVMPRIYQQGEGFFRGMALSLTPSLPRKNKDGPNSKTGDTNNNNGPEAKITTKGEESGKSVSFGGNVQSEAPVTGWSEMEQSVENDDEDANIRSRPGARAFSGKIASVATGSSTQPAVSGWSIMEEDEGVIEDMANGGSRLGDRAFSGKIASVATGRSTQPVVSGWSIMEEDEGVTEDNETAIRTNKPVSKRFSSGTGISSIPCVSGWSEFDNEDEAPGKNLHASKEFSDDEVESPQPSTDLPSGKSEKRPSWWEGPENDKLEVLLSNLEQERVEDHGGQAIKPSSSGSPASKENIGGKAGSPDSSSGGAVKDATATTMETLSRNTSPVSKSSDKRAKEKAERERVRVDHKANFKQREKEHREHLKRKKAAR